MKTLKDDIETISGQCAPPVATVTAIDFSDEDRTNIYDGIVDISRKAGIGLIRTAALMLKHEAEQQRATGTDPDVDGGSLLASWPTNEMIAALRPAFSDDPQFNEGDLAILFTEMVTLGLHNVPTDAEALEYFARQRQLTCEQATDADVFTRRRYDTRRRTWLHAIDDLGNLVLRREDAAVRVEIERQNFMEMFSNEFISEKSQSARLDVARLRRQLIKDNPGLSKQEIDEQLKSRLEEHAEKLRGYRISERNAFAGPPEDIPPSSPEDLAALKHAMRRLAMMTHPDRLQHLDLTPEQRCELARIWRDTHALRSERNPQGLVCRSLAVLEYNLQIAEQILETAGITGLDASLMIRGDTLEERAEWLARACAELDQQILALQAEIYALHSDPELKFMRALVEAPESVQVEQRKLMKNNAEKFREEAERIEKETEELLSLMPPPGGMH